MRWFWIDRFEKFVSGKEAVTIKNVTLAEEPLDDYLPGFPHYPHSLVIEGMAQTGGILLGEHFQFETCAILDESYGELPFFIPEDLSRLLRSLKLFDVGVNPDGSPIGVPTHMVEAERASLALP